jgi:Uma2 family endonuclease
MYYLQCECEFKGLGETCGEVGVVLSRAPDRVVGADAAFVLKESLPIRRSREDYLITIPEIIEVRSKNDWMPELHSKCEQYLAAGSVLVWVLDPGKKTVTEHRHDATPVTWNADDVLTCDLLPGFAEPVKHLFAS